jgi:hypothetical protein
MPSGSGTDYIAALLRLNHFAGTEVAFKERQTDSRRERNRLFYKRDVEPSGETDEMRPWIKAFVNKVGIQNATKLLSPLDKAYQNEDFSVTFGETKKTLVGSLPNHTTINFNNISDRTSRRDICLSLCEFTSCDGELARTIILSL